MTAPQQLWLSFVNTSDPVPAQFARRKWWLAGILGFLFPGSGHLYVGRATVGLLLLGAYYGIPAIIIASGFGQTAWGEMLTLGNCLGLLLLAVIQPIVVALRQPDQTQLRYMRWSVYSLYAIASVVVQLFWQPLFSSHTGGAIFSVPSPSMSPTLLQGDVIAVDPGAYVRQLPALGDVVVVRVSIGSRAETVNYVRRTRSVVPGPAPDGPRVEVEADNRDYDTPDMRMLSAKQVIGRVTVILWSRDLSRIGRRIQ